MVKRFKGQVEINQVKEALEDVESKINEMIDAYNESLELQDIDYSKGGVGIAPSGYTLSIGGLKTMMSACNGLVIGAKALRYSNNSLCMTTGVLITTNSFYRLPSKVISVSSKKGTVYFNTSTLDYSLTSGTNTVKICEYDINTDYINATEISKLQSENFDGYFRVTIPDRYPKPVATYDSGETHNDGTTTGPKFICAIDKQQTEGSGTANMYLFGISVASNRQTGHRNLNYWTPTNYLFLPKGISSSGIYTFGRAADNMTRFFNVKTSKNFSE